MGLTAQGFAAQGVRGYWGIKNRGREMIARSLAVWDTLTGCKPKFEGPREIVRSKAMPR